MPRVAVAGRTRTSTGRKEATIVLRGRVRVRRAADLDRALAACAAERLRFARTRERLSQEELARRAGLARPNVARLEAGRHVPNLSTLRRVADALRIPLAFLVTAPMPDPDEDRALAEAGIAEWRAALDRLDRAP